MIAALRTVQENEWQDPEFLYRLRPYATRFTLREGVLNPATGLRIDLLFDFPVPASTLVKRATRTTVRSRVFRVASAQDLLHLKKLANARRSAPGDAEDIAFLEARHMES